MAIVTLHIYIALFAWLISRIFLANEQYFSLTINQPTVLSTMAYQPSEQGTCVEVLHLMCEVGDVTFKPAIVVVH